MLKVLPEVILLILVFIGYFYLQFNFLFNGKRRKAKKAVKPIYLMDKKELSLLGGQVEKNILERDKIIRALKFLRETKSLNVELITYIKDIIVDDTEMKFSKDYSYLDIIELGMNEGYVSDKSLKLIKNKIENTLI